MSDHGKVLVYHHRHNGTPVIKDGLAIIDRAELANILAAHPELRSTSKALRRGAVSVDILQSDVLGVALGAYPNRDANVAGITLPISAVFWNLIRGEYGELVILSQKTGSA